MKRILILFLLIISAIGAVYYLNRDVDVTVVKSENDYHLAEQFNLDVASMVNKNDISVEIDEEDYQFNNKEKPYLSDNINVMFPLDAMTKAFDCSVMKYESGDIVIQKGEHEIKLYIDNKLGFVDEQLINLSDKVVSLNDEIYVPFFDIAAYLDFECIFDFTDSQVIINTIVGNDFLPKYYDMREYDRVSPIRDQGRFGTCWAFAALGALETSSLPEQLLVYSPDHMSLNNGFNLSQNDGGEYTMCIAYLASWKGPVLETEDPYGDGITNDDAVAVRHLEEAMIIDSKDYDSIKEAVYKYGGVQTSIFTYLTNSDSWSVYYNRDRGSYYFNGDAVSNHDIVIVGWNDEYPKEYFTIEPEGDGAFICRNSWGTDFGDDGYFYVSYYDNNIGTSNVAYTKVAPTDNFDNIYQSDLLGWVGQLGYGRESAFFANMYTAKDNELLEAASFYATAKDTSYKVYVAKDCKSIEDINDRQLVASGTVDNAGYYTVNFDKEIKLIGGEKFAIVVYINTPSAIHPVAIEYESDERTEKFDIGDGEGYISLYGEYWTNTETDYNCNLCLKAFTKNIEE